MKILVLSDTHGNVDFVRYAVSSVCPDYIIHLGDGIDDLNGLNFPSERIFMVCGNCDWHENLSYWRVIELNGRRIFFTHGDRFAVDSGTENLLTYAMMHNADIVLYGHTHYSCIVEKNNILILNPGSAMLGAHQHMCAVIEFNNGRTRAYYITRAGKLAE